MNKVLVTIEDTDEGLTLEGRVEDTTAFDRPPTPALVVGSYLAANIEQICKDAMSWFKTQVTAPPIEGGAEQ